MLLYALLVWVRIPNIWIKGRFWAEEGHLLFHNAWLLPPREALFAPFAGYLNLTSSAATLLARWSAPLAYAPYVTILVALLVQLLPAFLIVTARDAWLTSRKGARLVCLATLLLTSSSEEEWLQTIAAQFHLVVCCGIILALAPMSGVLRWLRLGILVLAPLSGPVSFVFLPLFALRAFLDRSRQRVFECAFLALGVALQTGLFFTFVPGRSYAADPVAILAVVYVRNIVAPFLGLDSADLASPRILSFIQAGHMPHVAVVLPIVFVSALLVLAAIYRRQSPALWLVVAAGSVAVFSYSGALGGPRSLITGYGGERYVYAPQALADLGMASLVMTAEGLAGWLMRAILIWLLSEGALQYLHPWRMLATGPSWRKEVAHFEKDHSYQPREWPPGWTVKLDGPY